MYPLLRPWYADISRVILKDTRNYVSHFWLYPLLFSDTRSSEWPWMILWPLCFSLLIPMGLHSSNVESRVYLCLTFSTYTFFHAPTDQSITFCNLYIYTHPTTTCSHWTGFSLSILCFDDFFLETSETWYLKAQERSFPSSLSLIYINTSHIKTKAPKAPRYIS